MSTSKRRRSSVTGYTQSEEQAAVNPREGVTETVRPASVGIAEFVAALDLWGLESISAALDESENFTNKAALQKAVEDRLEELEGGE